ncbi:MAG: hypothetical protein MJA30_06225 [Cytophagales bacterium]|nr:hypothetical protein [Cytophagales bacterium]
MKALNLTMTCCIVLVGFTTACNPQKAGESAINSQEEEVKTPSLHGGWTNISMTVEIKTEPDTVIEVPVGKWEEILGIKPILTTFKTDSSFISEYRNLGDSLFMTSTGVWWVANDTVYMEEQGVLNAYHFKIHHDTVTFTGYIDWDQDGEPDDLYYGSQVRAAL